MKKKKFEWKHRVLEDGNKENALFVDGEMFDWEVDKESLIEVFATGDAAIIKAAQQDISRHYLDSLSEFIGKKIEFSDIEKAEKTGWI